MGHPRALFDGILDHVDLGKLDTADLVHSRKKIVEFCKFVISGLEEHLCSWLSSGILSNAAIEQLTLSGVLQRVVHPATDDPVLGDK